MSNETDRAKNSDAENVSWTIDAVLKAYEDVNGPRSASSPLGVARYAAMLKVAQYMTAMEYDPTSEADRNLAVTLLDFGLFTYH